MKNIKKLEELKRELEQIENVDILTAYCGDYISDIIAEVANNQTEIYTKALFDKSWELYQDGYIDQAISEFGETDLIRIFMSADYLKQSDHLYSNLDNLVLYYAIEFLEDNYKNIDIDIINDILNDITKQSFDRIDNIDNYIIDYIETY